MKKLTTTITCLLFVALSGLAQTISNPNGFTMHTGVNLAIWLSQSDKRGVEREQFISEKDLESLSSMGFDHVRLPVDEVQLWDENGNPHDDAFKLMHNAIGWAIEREMRVIVDLHIIRSHFFNAKSNPLWDDPAEQEKLLDLWLYLSKELKKYPVKYVAYELMNEAVAEDHEDWNKLVAKLVAGLRKVEPERTILIGSNRWQGTETFPELKVPENDKNIILSFHYYRPFGLTHYRTSWTSLKDYKGPVHYPGEVVTKKEMKAIPEDVLKEVQWAFGYWDKEKMLEDIQVPMSVAKKYDLPLYCGEYGVFYTAPREDALRWYQDLVEIFNENGIAFGHWDYKTSFGILKKDGEPWMELVDVLTGGGEK